MNDAICPICEARFLRDDDGTGPCPGCVRKYPPSLLRAARQQGLYRLSLRGEPSPYTFTSAVIHGQYATLRGTAANKENMDVRVNDIVWCLG